MASAECAPLFARWMSGAADPESDEAALCACVAALDSHQAFLKMRCLIPPLEDTVMRLVGACPPGAPFRKPPFSALQRADSALPVRSHGRAVLVVPCEPARSDVPGGRLRPHLGELPGLAARRRQREALQDADHAGRGRAFLYVRAGFLPDLRDICRILRRVLRLLPADGGRGPASRGLSHHAVRPHASGRGGEVPGPLHELRRGPGLTRGHLLAAMRRANIHAAVHH